jgi:hypothetical protein
MRIVGFGCRYGTTVKDKLTPNALDDTELDACFLDVDFGIAAVGPPIPNASAIKSNEADEVARRRERYGIHTRVGSSNQPDMPKGKNAVGLALSGGGIRSATFCLGVVQVLADRDLLKDVDFLSTVSGGGYAGSFLTTRLGAGQPHTSVARPYGPDPEAIRYLRRHAKYLAAVDLKQSWSMVTATFAGMLLNWAAPLLLIVIAALVAVAYKQWVPLPPWATILAVCGVATLAALVLYAGLMRAGPVSARVGGWLLAVAIAVTALLGVLWALDASFGPVVAGLGSIPRTIADHWGVSGIVAAVTAAGPAIVRFVPVLKTPAVRKIVLQVLLLVAGLVIPLGALTLFYVFPDLPACCEK